MKLLIPHFIKNPLARAASSSKDRVMKASALNLFRFAAGMILASSASLIAQTATTDPVGFITLNIAGTGGTAQTALSLAGLGLTRSVEYQGSAEAVGTNTLVDNEATWTDNQFNGANGTYFVEVTSGAAAGTTYDISGTTAATKAITTAQNLAGGVAAGASFKIRKHWTIASVFGAANEGGLQGGSSSSADQVLLYNGTGYDTYFYSTGGLTGVGWRKNGAGATDQGATVIYPDDGIITIRKQSALAKVVVMGAVKTGQTSSPVQPGLNLLGNVYAANMTLADSGLYTGNAATGVAPGSSSTADQVLLFNGTSYDTYFYSNGGLTGTGWRKNGSGATDFGSQSIPVGTALIIQRKNAAGFNWVAPQHPATL
jgi:uncharacterized protein (TIGR02597 family)